MASLLEDDPSQQTDSTLLNVGESGGLSDALGHLYSSVKSYLAPAAAAQSFPYAGNPVGTERVGGEQSLTMPSPDVSPLLGMFGDQPLTAATHARALNIASNLAQFGPADVGAIKAFHGSPYDFSAFDASKIGTGEGAQAYGHGMYAAEAEGTAQSYRDALGPQAAMDALDSFLSKNRGMNLRLEEISARLAGTPAAKLADDPQAIASLQKLLPNYLPNAAVMGSDLQYYRYLDDAANRMLKGHMYEVSIAADPEHMLDWDEPLSEQSQHVQDAMRAQFKAQGGESYYRPKMTGEQAHSLLGLNQPLIAQSLQERGIPGIKYLDQSSRAAGKGTSNYVVFDPATIAILRKYGIAGVMGGGTAATQGGNGQNQ